MFKIRNKSTGLYWKPGYGWHKTGKIWSTKGHLRLHLSLIQEGLKPSFYNKNPLAPYKPEDVIIEEYEPVIKKVHKVEEGYKIS